MRDEFISYLRNLLGYKFSPPTVIHYENKFVARHKLQDRVPIIKIKIRILLLHQRHSYFLMTQPPAYTTPISNYRILIGKLNKEFLLFWTSATVLGHRQIAINQILERR